uniref:Nudix hydrolase domain-containing protein n=1 Tax=Clastoptera arizonana TaxID=38151 RepID=A0A1B6D1X3_9HEMI
MLSFLFFIYFSGLYSSIAANMEVSNVFVGNEDHYKGIHVDSVKEPCENQSSFSLKLQDSLKKWSEKNVKAIWFKVDLKNVDWVPILAKNGFRFHHAEGEIVHMCKWLPDNEESCIPLYAHTTVGAGGVVINSKGQLLVVQQRFQNTPYWKLPGGYVEPGENIATAVIREVLEETNITTMFKSIIAFRHSHQAAFGCSDLYFIVELEPISDHIIKEDKEIEACEWMEIDKFLTHPNVHENNRLFIRQYLTSKELRVSILGQEAIHPISKKPQMLYGISNRKE